MVYTNILFTLFSIFKPAYANDGAWYVLAPTCTDCHEILLLVDLHLSFKFYKDPTCGC